MATLQPTAAILDKETNFNSLSWPAIFAGNAVTGGLLLVMIPLGTAAGLAMASPYANQGASASAIGIASVVWVAFMYLFATAAGGYVAGRLRPRLAGADRDEVSFRDSINGVVFWGVGMIVSALFTFYIVTSAISTAGQAVGSAVSGVASTAAQSLPAVNTDYVSDLFLRPSGKAAPAQPGAAPNAAPRTDADVRAEIGRIMTASAANGQISEPDKQYLAQLVAQRTGVTPDEAKATVDNGIKRATELRDRAAAQAKDAAEAARKGASRAAFWTAVLSLLAGVAAMYAAQLGGRHRDEGRYA